MSGHDRLSHHLDGCLNKALALVGRWDEDALLAENIDVLVEDILRQCWPVPIVIEWDQATRSPGRETKVEVPNWTRERLIEVPGMSVEIGVPCSGDVMLLRKQASTYSLSGGIQGQVTSTGLRLTIEDRDLSADHVLTTFNRWRAAVDKQAEWVNGDIDEARANADQRVRGAIEERRARIAQLRAIDEALPFHMLPISDGPGSVPIRITRTAPVGAQRTSSHPFVPECVLEEADFQSILDVCSRWGNSLERTPGATLRLGEEGLRNLLLATLNTHWAGRATGETFNGAGKTDILIRENDRNVFIAECKIWGGPKAAAAAVDQLLSYLVWRDAKACLIFFIGTKDPSATIGRLHEAIRGHSAFLVEKAKRDDGRADFVMAADNEGRRVSLVVLPFVVAR